MLDWQLEPPDDDWEEEEEIEHEEIDDSDDRIIYIDFDEELDRALEAVERGHFRYG